jgi:hypothetical protein
MRGKLAFQRLRGLIEHVDDLAPVGTWLQRLGLDAGHLQKVFHDALEAAVGRLNLHRVGIALSQAVQGRADDGDGRFQLVRHAVEQRAMQPLGFREQFCAVFGFKQLFALGMMLLQCRLTFAQPRDEMPHAQRHHEKQPEQHHVLRLLDVQRELRRDEKEIPHQRAHHAHGQHWSAIPSRPRQHDRHQKHQRGELVARVRQQNPARGGEHKEDRQSPAKLADHMRRHRFAGWFGRLGLRAHDELDLHLLP